MNPINPIRSFTSILRRLPPPPPSLLLIWLSAYQIKQGMLIHNVDRVGSLTVLDFPSFTIQCSVISHGVSQLQASQHFPWHPSKVFCFQKSLVAAITGSRLHQQQGICKRQSTHMCRPAGHSCILRPHEARQRERQPPTDSEGVEGHPLRDSHQSGGQPGRDRRCQQAVSAQVLFAELMSFLQAPLLFRHAIYGLLTPPP